MHRPRVYADFQKVDGAGYLALTAQGSIRDLDALGGQKEGTLVVFYSDDENDLGEPDELEVEGELKFDSAQWALAMRMNPRANQVNRTSQNQWHWPCQPI